jgi:hypothetical protein
MDEKLMQLRTEMVNKNHFLFDLLKTSNEETQKN